MKKSLAGIVIVLLLVLASCYVNNYDKILVTFSDEGVYLEDPTMHVVKMSVPSGYPDIYYTLDGTTVTASSTLYEPDSYYNIDFQTVEGVLLPEGAVVKAVGAKYSSDKDKLTYEGEFEVKKSDRRLNAAPEIIKRGVYSSDDDTAVVEIAAADSSYEIYYTVDGTLPVPDGLSYSENVKTVKNNDGLEVTGIIVPMDTEIKAVTKDRDGNYSYVSTLVVYSTAAPVVEDLGPDSSGTGRIYSIKSYDGTGTIYYTTDNSDPVKFGEMYSPSSYTDADGNTVYGIKVSEGKTLSVVIKRSSGLKYKYSMVLSFPAGDLISWSPCFAYLGSSATDDDYEVVSLSSSDKDALIYYTLDGSDPKDNGILYTPSSILCNSIETAGEETVKGITLKRGVTIKAVAVNGTTYSNMTTQKVEGRLALTPKLIDYGYSRDGYMIVSLSSPDGQGTIYCTTNGTTDPKKQKTAYSESTYTTQDGKTVKGKEISVGSTLRAVVKYGDDYSAELVQKLIAPDKYKPAVVNKWQAADYQECQIMALTLPSSVDINSAQFYYTTDDSDPKTNGTLYAPEKYKDNLGNEKEGVLVKTGTRIKAVTKNGFMYSDITEAEAYDTVSWAPLIINRGTSNTDESKQIIEITAPEGVEIFYARYNEDPSGSAKISYTTSAKEYTNISGYSYKGVLIDCFLELRAISKNGDIYSEEKNCIVVETKSWKPQVTWASYSDTQAVVTFTSSKADVKFYYTTDDKNPAGGSGIEYVPQEYTVKKGNKVTGVLVDFNKTLKIVALSGSLYSDETREDIYEKESWAPKIVNEGGYSSSSQIISLTSTDKNAEIYYNYNINSLNNYSNKYSETQYTLRSGEKVNGITYGNGQYIYAVAKIGDKVSDITQLYIEDTYSWAPQISRKGKNNNNGNEEVVVISNSNSDVTILYTTNGDDPRINGIEYESATSTYTSPSGTFDNAIAVPYGTNGTTVKCVARKGDKDKGYTYSDVIVLEVYEKSSWAPKITNNGSNSNGYQIISMETTASDAKIYYDTSSYVDSYDYSYSDKKSSYNLRSGEQVQGISTSSGNTIYAVAYRNGRYSDVTSLYINNTYSIAPAVSLKGKNANNSKEIVIELTTALSGATILYTTDDSDPRTNGTVYEGSSFTVNGTVYNDAISVEAGKTLRCVAYKENGSTTLYSDVISTEVYDKSSWAPVLVNEGSTASSRQIVSMNSSSDGAVIYYSTSYSSDSSIRTYGSVYSGQNFTLRSGKTAKGMSFYYGKTVYAVAYKDGKYSDVTSLYIMDTYSFAPTITYKGKLASNTNGRVVVISSNSSDSTILYTRDDSDPRLSGREYDGSSYTYISETGSNKTVSNAIAVGYGFTVKCVARKTGNNGEYIYSDVVSLELLDPSSFVPVLENMGSTSDGYQVIQMSCSRDDADIYYTTNSSTSPQNGYGYSSYKGTYTLCSGEQVEGVKISSENTIRAVSTVGAQYSDITSLYVEDTYSFMPVYQYLGTNSNNSNAAVVKLISSSSDVAVYYTLDETDPRVLSNRCNYDGGAISYYNTSGYNLTASNAISVTYGNKLKFVSCKNGSNGKPVYSDVITVDVCKLSVNTKYSSYYQWTYNTSVVKDGIQYSCYQSSNYNINNSYSVMKITFSGVSTFTIYIRSYAESGCDYTIASTVDASSVPTSSGYVTTSNKQSSSEYTKVTYNNLSTGEHYIYVVYRKDGSVHSGNDRGYVLVPISQ